MDITDLGWVDKLLDLKPPVLLMLALYIVGRIIKSIPRIENWVILLVLPTIGAIVYPWVGERSEIIKAMKIPTLGMAMFGLGIGWCATGAYEALSRLLPKMTFIPDWARILILGQPSPEPQITIPCKESSSSSSA